MRKHKKFILTPITGILREVASANAVIGSGIETCPLSEYIFQSIFLKMTGFHEQKMKCICWELATDDYEYRYQRFTLNPIGEGSSYKDKSTVYKDLIELIKKNRATFNIDTEINRPAVRVSALSEIYDLCSKSNISSWAENTFLEFLADASLLPLNQFALAHTLFESVLKEKYELLYKHRNRCAHNIQSYQENLPTLSMLFNADTRYDHYFSRFALLNLLDKIFVELFTIYMQAFEEN